MPAPISPPISPDAKPERIPSPDPKVDPGAVTPGVGVFGVMLRCIGWAE